MCCSPQWVSRELIRLLWEAFVELHVLIVLSVDLPVLRFASDYLVCRWTELPWPRVGFSAAAPGTWNTPPSPWEWPPTAPAPRPDTARRCCSATGSGWHCPPRRDTTRRASCKFSVGALVVPEMSRMESAHGRFVTVCSPTRLASAPS